LGCSPGTSCCSLARLDSITWGKKRAEAAAAAAAQPSDHQRRLSSTSCCSLARLDSITWHKEAAAAAAAEATHRWSKEEAEA
jgi:hypothetical protein